MNNTRYYDCKLSIIRKFFSFFFVNFIARNGHACLMPEHDNINNATNIKYLTNLLFAKLNMLKNYKKFIFCNKTQTQLKIFSFVFEYLHKYRIKLVIEIN